jgi:hypothetical protein
MVGNGHENVHLIGEHFQQPAVWFRSMHGENIFRECLGNLRWMPRKKALE